MRGVKCKHIKKDGTQCGAWAVEGAVVCAAAGHGGSLPSVRRKAMIVAEINNWRIGDTTEDPGEVLLRLVTQSSRRVALYSSLLEAAYEHAELVGEDGPMGALSGGLQALIGGTWSDDGDGRIYQTGEQIRGLVALENGERDRCAGFATKAIAAGLAERQVRMAERVGAAILDVINAGLDAAGITGQARILAQNAAADKLLEIAA